MAERMPGKVSVYTLGCSKNRVDSEHLMRQLENGGWDVIPDAGHVVTWDAPEATAQALLQILGGAGFR